MEQAKLQLSASNDEHETTSKIEFRVSGKALETLKDFAEEFIENFSEETVEDFFGVDVLELASSSEFEAPSQPGMEDVFGNMESDELQHLGDALEQQLEAQGINVNVDVNGFLKDTDRGENSADFDEFEDANEGVDDGLRNAFKEDNDDGGIDL